MERGSIMKRLSFLIIAISFLAMVAGTAMADNSKPVDTSNPADLNYVNGIWTANPYTF
jgi:hypothetical protein